MSMDKDLGDPSIPPPPPSSFVGVGWWWLSKPYLCINFQMHEFDPNSLLLEGVNGTPLDIKDSTASPAAPATISKPSRSLGW